MSVVRKGDDRSSPAIEHAAPRDVRVVNEVLQSVSLPVDWQTHASEGIWYAVVVDVAVGIVEVQDALVAPEIDRDRLETGHVISEPGNGRVLSVADPVVLENVAFQIGEENARVAGCVKDLQPFPISEVGNGDPVGVILNLVLEVPEHCSVVIEQREADGEFVVAVVIDVAGAGVMTCGDLPSHHRARRSRNPCSR